MYLSLRHCLLTVRHLLGYFLEASGDILWHATQIVGCQRKETESREYVITESAHRCQHEDLASNCLLASQ